MTRRIALAISFIAVNLMACCCGGVGNFPPPQRVAVAKPANPVPTPVEQPPLLNPVQVEPPTPKAEPPAPKKKTASRSDRIYVSREEFGDKWPLTVEDGEIEGYKYRVAGVERKAVVFHTGGKTYAVNGGAIDQRKFPRIDPIWAEEPRSELWIKNNIPAIKKSIEPIISIGLGLCK